ncbi:MAG: CRISPR-associated protein Csd2 [Bryobacterales bacterium]|jgi:CRISPR-associated protein Csd2|nr:CRISPR-associated protein Csd2 [Bryobacterales bacterium]
MNSPIQKRYDFVYLFDWTDSNPNGDPDSANAPRFDPETFQGLVTDVCLKRKIRDYIAIRQNGLPGFGIYIMAGQALEKSQEKPYVLLNLTKKTKERKPIEEARDWMCQNFFDVRTFGAVMSTTDFNCGQVRGPVQLGFARSIDRVFSTEHSITRQVQTTVKDFESKGGMGTFGQKHTVAYGLYRVHGFVNAHFAAQTGFGEQDLDLLWKALANMFDVDRSAARCGMAPRGLFVFEHASALGEFPAHLLFDRIKISKRESVEIPRSIGDYIIDVDSKDLPAGVRLLQPFGAAAGA